MSKRNSREAKARRREAKSVERSTHLEAGQTSITPDSPSYLDSDEAYLRYILATPEDQLTDRQRELAREIRAHHPELA